LNQCLSRDLLTSDTTVKREKEEEKISQNMSFLASVKALTDMSDFISSCNLNTIDKSECHVSKKHNLQLFLYKIICLCCFNKYCKFNLMLKIRNINILLYQQTAVYYHAARKI